MRAGTRILAEARLRIDSEVDRATQAMRAQLGRRRRRSTAMLKRLAALHPRARLHRDRGRARRAGSGGCTRIRRASSIARARRSTRCDKRLEARLREALEKRRRAFGVAVGKLEAMSPLAVLERGYSLTRTPDGPVVTDARAGRRRATTCACGFCAESSTAVYNPPTGP